MHRKKKEHTVLSLLSPAAYLKADTTAAAAAAAFEQVSSELELVQANKQPRM